MSGVHRFCLYFLVAILMAASSVYGDVPEYTVVDGEVRLVGVSKDNPIIYDNDWWFDVFDNNYLWARASLGSARLRGNIVTRDMWDWDKGYHYSMDSCVDDARKALTFARESGLRLPPLPAPSNARGAPARVRSPRCPNNWQCCRARPCRCLRRP